MAKKPSKTYSKNSADKKNNPAPSSKNKSDSSSKSDSSPSGGLSDSEFAELKAQMKKVSSFGEKLTQRQKEIDSLATPDYNRLVKEQDEEKIRKWKAAPARVIHMLRGQSQGKDGRWLENRMGGGGFELGPKLQIEDEWAVCGYRVFGDAYIIHSGSRAPALDAFLDRDKGPHIHIQDGDTVQTQNRSYVWGITTGVRAEEGKASDEFKIDIGPNSKARFFIDIKKSKGKYEGGEYFTLIEHKISKVELIEGIFHIKINGGDVNRRLEFAGGYRGIEFAEPLMLSLAGDAMTKSLAKATGPIMEQIKKTISQGQARSKASWRSEQSFEAFLELRNGTLTIFGCPNKIIGPGAQETKMAVVSNAIKNLNQASDPLESMGEILGNNVKVTFSNGKLTETDLNAHPDSHVVQITKCMNYCLNAYLQVLDAKKELASMKEVNMKTIQDEGDKAYKEAEQMLQDAKDIDDPELIKVAKAMLDGAKKSGEDNELNRGTIEAFKMRRKILEKQIANEGKIRSLLTSLS
ncbi:MAG: hypothetical protein WC492_05240 [Candidatus Micrarchaeia archaeon]